MKNIKRVISIILLLSVLISSLSVTGISVGAKESAKAASGNAMAHSGQCGKNAKWNLSDDGVLTVSGTGKMYDYGVFPSGTPWFLKNSYIKEVIIESGITYIGSKTFYGCEMTKLTIPATVTDISNDAFDYCNYINEIYINDIASWCKISSAETNTYLLSRNVKLYLNNELIEELIVPEGVTEIKPRSFYNCVAIKFVKLADSVESIGKNAFNSCDNLEDIDFGNGLKTIGESSFRYTKIKRLNIPASLTSIDKNAVDNLYIECISVEDASQSFSSLNGVLYNKDKTVLVIYPGASPAQSFAVPEGVVKIDDYAFSQAKNLKLVELNDSLIEIGINSFVCCYNLESVKFGNCLENISNCAFSGCFKLTDVVLPDSVKYIGEAAFDTTALKEFTVPAGVTHLSSLLFGCCGDLELVIIGENVTSIGDEIFLECGKLTVKCKKDSYVHEYMLNNYPDISLIFFCDAHSFTNYISDNNGNCFEDGTMTAFCDNGCGATDTVTKKNSKVHQYILETLREATCSQNGLGMYMCSICQDYYTVSLSTSAHSYTNFVYNNDATCMAEGSKTAYCDYHCGKNITVTAEGSKTAHKYTDYVYNNDATCSANGTQIAFCDYGCGTSETIVVEGTMLEHDYSVSVIEEATPTSNGTTLYICNVCKYYYTEIIPMLKDQIFDTDGYDVIINSSENIKYIRYASGEALTSKEIKNAPDCVVINARQITDLSDNGVFRLTMAEGGVYSVWIKLYDQSEYTYTADLTKMEQRVDVIGVNVTVKNLYGVKDFFIAKGENTTYSEIKSNYIFNVTSNKINGAHDYNYILPGAGVYTVCIRYDDISREHKYITFEASVTEPAFTENGLQLTVGNLEGVKVIRTANGEYSSVAQIKSSKTHRSFSAKDVLRGKDEYTIQYKEEGLASVAVCYENGYTVIYKYDAVKKKPVMVQNENTITFASLEDLKVLRYAKGEYMSSAEIKKASTSVAISGKKLTSDSFSVDLNPGVYTFCVQYNDESYNYYTVTVK